MNNESASKFISALVKALQTLCHGYIEFNDGIEIIGHIYLNIDSGASFDYVVKEKLCKNTENSTVFVSKSFQAQAPLDECLTRKDKNDHTTEFDDAPDMSPTTGTSRIASAITSISNVLSGTQDSQKSRLLDHSSHHSSAQNTAKRKRDHSGSYSSMQPPVKYTTLQASSSSSSPYFSSEPSSKLPADRNHSEHFNASSHGEFFGADSNQSSGMGADEEDDLHLDVTFVKEEYQRNSSHRGAPASAASRLSQELSSSHSNILHDGTSGVGALGYSSSHHQGSHFASGTAGDIGSLNDNFHDASQVEIGHNAAQGPANPRSEMADGASHTFQVPAVPMKYFRCPVCSIIIQHKNNILRHMRQHNASLTLQDSSSTNRHITTPSPEGSAFDLSATSHFSPQSFTRQKGVELVHTTRQTKWAVARARDDASAGPPPRMPEGVKPLCGYVHPDDAKKWMMYDLMPGSGVYIHQENYNVVLSKTRQDRPDGKAMARYLMSCFWRQSELVGASIAEPPKPHQRSLDRSIVHAILGFCQHHTSELPTDIRRTMQQKIGYAKFYFVKKTLDPDSPKTTPASISVEASPRRMSMEMARRGAGGLPLELALKLHTGEIKGRRASDTLSRGLSEGDDVTSRLPPRGMPDLPTSGYNAIANDLSNRLSDESGRHTVSTPVDIISDRLPTDVSSRLSLGRLARKMSAELGSRISADFSGRVVSDLSGHISADSSGRLPNDLSTRSVTGLSARSADFSSNRMSTERAGGTTLDILTGRSTETSLSETANRIGSVPAGMSRGFLDMLNNIYPSN